eukprot:CAMPEP_0174723070 /NCGR_PEP_ID=MMETSP1094-20130205/39989_1 /TAXON_ID=156173 /ORGANISM="Chrysochromulina brevifilum, Strain UTEX LB 985" /LENGTH=183 /DNA_ID=CAMNT_0015924045 /DNA_START=727 /DNA_END=1278 /DNA_ORIENTATION=-
MPRGGGGDASGGDGLATVAVEESPGVVTSCVQLGGADCEMPGVLTMVVVGASSHRDWLLGSAEERPPNAASASSDVISVTTGLTHKEGGIGSDVSCTRLKRRKDSASELSSPLERGETEGTALIKAEVLATALTKAEVLGVLAYCGSAAGVGCASEGGGAGEGGVLTCGKFVHHRSVSCLMEH